MLANAPLARHYLLHGEETFLVERALALLRRRLAPRGRADNLRTLWAEDGIERLQQALDDLGSPLLFGGTQVLVVRRVEALADGAQERLLAALPTLGDGSCLLLVGRSIDARKRLFAACIRSGDAHAFPAVADTRVARDIVVSFAREDGSLVAPAAVEALVERLGTDIGQLMGEIEKLSLHVGGRRIEVEDVHSLVGQVRARAVEELTDRIARRDLGGAIGVLRGLLGAGEPALRIVAFLAANVRRALHVADLADAGLGREEIAQRLRMPGWLVAKSLGRGRAVDLIRTQRALHQVDLDLKRSRPADATLERMLLEITAGRISRPTGA